MYKVYPVTYSAHDQLQLALYCLLGACLFAPGSQNFQLVAQHLLDGENALDINSVFKATSEGATVEGRSELHEGGG